MGVNLSGGLKMREAIYISMLLIAIQLTGCISVEIPVGDAIRSTKEWINEERQRDKPPAQPANPEPPH
jgi:hypothetical protein